MVRGCIAMVNLLVVVIFVGIDASSVSGEGRNLSTRLTSLSNRSKRIVMANVRFDNGSDSNGQNTIPGYFDIKIRPRTYASVVNSAEKGRVLVDLWLQGGDETAHFELAIGGTDLGFVMLNNKDRWAVDVFRTVDGSVSIPRGVALVTLHPADPAR